MRRVLSRIPTERWAVLVILFLTFGIYAMLWDAPPLPWDDDSNIFANPYYQSQQWKVFWTDAYYGLYVPVISFLWQVLYTSGEGSVWPFRAFNLALHLINICLVFVLLKGLASRWGFRSSWPVLAGVMLFAWHPLQVESVAWISGGRDLLAATFGLAAILFYVRDRSLKTFWLSTIFFVLSLLSKPSSAILPVVCMGLDLMWRRREVRQLWPRLLLWFGFALYAVQRTTSAQIEHLPPVEWWLRPWVMADTYAFYIRKFLWPIHLSANYARTPDFVLSHPSTLGWALAFALLLCLYSLWAWRKEPQALILWFWMILLLPVSGLVSFGFQKISTTADHYLYLPLIALSASCLLLLSQESKIHRAKVVLSAVFLGGFFVLSGMRIQVWRSTEAFFKDMAKTSPKDYSTAIGMSVVECREKENFEQGVAWTNVALAARPGDISALANQAYCLLHAKNYFAVGELEDQMNRTDLADLEMKQPTAYSSFLASLGTALVEIGQLQEGFLYLCEAYRVKPSEPNHAHNLEVAIELMQKRGLKLSCPQAPHR